MASPSLALIDDPCLYLIYKCRNPAIADGVVCEVWSGDRLRIDETWYSSKVKNV